MILYVFTEPELAFFREFCNFTEEEKRVFDLRSKNVTLDGCAEHANYSEVKKISVRVNDKVRKMLTKKNLKFMEEWIENVYWERVMKDK